MRSNDDDWDFGILGIQSRLQLVPVDSRHSEIQKQALGFSVAFRTQETVGGREGPHLVSNRSEEGIQRFANRFVVINHRDEAVVSQRLKCFRRLCARLFAMYSQISKRLQRVPIFGEPWDSSSRAPDRAPVAFPRPSDSFFSSFR